MWEWNTVLLTGAFALGAYLIGSVNISLLATRLLGLPDVRTQGSGNPGATNLFRTAGPKVAVPVLVADLAKACLIVWAAESVLPSTVSPVVLLPLVLGNLYPLFHGFRGGKGVAATVGGVLALAPTTMLLGGCVFLIVFGVSRRVSAGSISMVVAYPIIQWATGGSGCEIAVIAVLTAIIIFTHRTNIIRLIERREPAIGSSRGDRK